MSSCLQNGNRNALESTMIAVILIFVITIALATFDVMSLTFGADSRDGIGDDHHRSTVG